MLTLFATAALLAFPSPLAPDSATDRTLVHEAVIEAPLAEAWRLSTTSEGARQWMAPKVEVDFRVGGAFRASYHPESNLNDEHTIVNRILTYAPMRMLAIQNVQAPAGFEHMDHFQRTWSVMYFESVDETRTRVRIVGLGYGEGPEWDALYGFFKQGNTQVLALLQQAVDADRSERAQRDHKQTNEPAGDVLKPIVIESSINATLDDLWRMWTTSEGVKEFLEVNSNIDLRIGGPLELYFGESLPEGRRGSEGCRILAYEPNRMFSFSWNAPPHLPFAREKHTWVVVDFNAVSEHETRVRLTHYGLEERRAEFPDHAAEFVAAHAYFTRGWASVLGKLKTHLEQQ